MNPFQRRREQRKRREAERRKARREAVSTRLGRSSEEPSETKTEAKGKEGQPARAKAKPPARAAPRRDRQRSEPLGQRALALLAAARTAFMKGARATAGRAGAAQPLIARVGASVGRALRLAGTAVLRLAAIIERLLRRSIGAIAGVVAAAVERLSRLLTPERAVFGVTVAVAACLVVSQFIAYHGVEIDQSAYAQVADIVRAPQRDVQDAGQAHAYLLIPVALLAVAFAALALRRGRWQLGRLVSLAGLAAVAVVLLVDMPKGLDEGDLAIRYNGAHAVLRDGFYAELVAAAALIFCGLLLSMHLRPAKRPARRRRRERRRRTRPGKAPSLARSGT